MKIASAAVAVSICLSVFAAVAGGALVTVDEARASSAQISKLPGRWKGSGSVKFDGGAKETIKCIATYFVKQGGKSLQQNLRCSTVASYKINARSELQVKGSRLAGTWSERNTGNDGAVTGRVTDAGFRLSVTGATFTAAMRVKLTGKCSQTISISPSGLGVKRISISLRKC